MSMYDGAVFYTTGDRHVLEVYRLRENSPQEHLYTMYHIPFSSQIYIRHNMVYFIVVLKKYIKTNQWEERLIIDSIILLSALSIDYVVTNSESLEKH